MNTAINTSGSLDCRHWCMDILSVYRAAFDIEVAAVVCAWVCNGGRNDQHAARWILGKVMGGQPHRFVMGQPPMAEDPFREPESMYGVLTVDMFFRMVWQLKEHMSVGGLSAAFARRFGARGHGRGVWHNHDVMADLLSGGTGWAHSGMGGTGFRYNLLLYLLMRTAPDRWGGYGDRQLLPCNDAVFAAAKGAGLTAARMKSSMKNTIALTRIARERYGDDFIRLYEELTGR